MSVDPKLVAALADARCGPCFPTQTRPLAIEIGKRTLALLFPHFAEGSQTSTNHELELEIQILRGLIIRFLDLIADKFPHSADGEVTADAFVQSLLKIHTALIEDAEAVFYADPAAESVDEVILSYPGFLATAYYRIAHELQLLGTPLLPRLLSQDAHQLTGIDIHPAAVIGRKFSIDHGTGVVIGETCAIGNGVKLYQGVTLGALSVDRSLQNVKRHPTIEDNVVIYANATILGGETVIGHDSVIGGNALVTSSIPSFSLVNRQSRVRPRSENGEDLIDFII